jgi:hypothetical protein
LSIPISTIGQNINEIREKRKERGRKEGRNAVFLIDFPNNFARVNYLPKAKKKRETFLVIAYLQSYPRLLKNSERN